MDEAQSFVRVMIDDLLFWITGEAGVKIKFWGVRGSIASPGPDTVRYGGNTTCIEVRSDDNDLVILDGGTGIFPLAQSLMNELPITANIFVTHSHWDHIQGLPFFLPVFVAGNRINLYAPFDPVTQQGVDHIMAVQMQHSYFPVSAEEVKSRFEYLSMTQGETVRVGSIEVTPVLMNHPVIAFGYRVACNGKSLFFTGDHEPYTNIYSPADKEYAEYQRVVEEKNLAIIRAIEGVDVLIADSSYALNEYSAKIGWGHGTFDSNIILAKRVGAKILCCTHHEPSRSDDELERVFNETMARHHGRLNGLEVRLAWEGAELMF